MSVRLPESCKGLCSIDDVRPAARSETRGRRSERSDREGDRRASGERDGEQKHAGAKRKAEESKEGDGDQWSQPPDKQGRMGSAVDVGA